MLRVTYRARLNDRSSYVHTVEIGRVRDGVLSDYVARERTADGEIAAQVELLEYPRWAEHASGLAARCAQLLWPSPRPSQVAKPSTGPQVEAAWIDLGFGSQRRGMRRSLERSEYVRTGFAPRIRVARENWPALEYPAPATLRADTGTIVMLLALTAWRTTDVPELPKPLDVRVHVVDNGTPVVRFSDIPEPARTAFDKWMDGATVPTLDCAYVWDWKRFIEGN